MNFSDFPLNANLLKGIEEAGYTTCTPVQEETMKEVFHNGRDVYAQSQTGTGKTAAFLIPTFEHLLKEGNEATFALVIVPTRELAVQVEKEASLLGKYLRMKMVAIYGGVGYDQQIRGLSNNPRIIVGTPGRLMDFCQKGTINLQKASVMCIDEADRLFDMGFVKDVKYMLSMMRPPKERRNMLYSATLNAKVGNLAWEHMNNPIDIVIEGKKLTVDAIDQGVYHVARNEKMSLLLAILKTENPYSAVIFSNTKAGAGRIADLLNKAGYKCALLEGNVPQRKRIRIVADVKAGKIQFLSATDVAARGLHVPNLDLVINYDLPDDHENYVHRIGRTARAGQSGKAYSFACDRYIYNLNDIERYIGKKIPVKKVSEELQEAINEMRKIQNELKKADAELIKEHSHRDHQGNDRSEHDRPARPPRAEYRSYGENRERPSRGSYADRPRGPRPEGSRPYGDRPPREAGDRPRGPRPEGSRPYGDRPPREAGDRPRSPRPEGSRPYGDRPPREAGDRPRSPRPEGSSYQGKKGAAGANNHKKGGFLTKITKIFG